MEYKGKAYNRWGIFYPVVLYRGRVVGNWSRVMRKGQTQITASFFEELEIDPERWKKAENKYIEFNGGLGEKGIG